MMKNLKRPIHSVWIILPLFCLLLIEFSELGWGQILEGKNYVSRTDRNLVNLSRKSNGMVHYFELDEISLLPKVTLDQERDDTSRTLLDRLDTISDEGRKEGVKISVVVPPNVKELLIHVAVDDKREILFFAPEGEIKRKEPPHQGTVIVEFRAGKALKMSRPISGAWRIEIFGKGKYHCQVKAIKTLAMMIVDGRQERDLNNRMGYDWLHRDDQFATAVFKEITAYLQEHMNEFSDEQRKRLQGMIRTR